MLRERQTEARMFEQAEPCEQAPVQKAAPRYSRRTPRHKSIDRIAVMALVILVPVLVCFFAVQFIRFVLWIAFPVTHP